MSQPRDDVGDDRIAVLAARVVIGDDDAIGKPLRDGAHERSLAGIALAAATEHATQSPGAVFAHGQQRLLQRIRRVCLFDDRDRRARRAQRLHAAWRGAAMLEGCESVVE